MRKIVVAVTGSSGSIYASLLLEELAQIRDQWDKVAVVFSENALYNWQLELGEAYDRPAHFDHYEAKDFLAPFASGSARYDTMIIIPASMGTVGRIAGGISDNLITRAADVMLKEKRRLILVPREMPFNLIHLRNMTTLAQAGAIICPASPSYYSRPQTLRALAATVVHRVLDLAGFDKDSFRWGEE